MPAFSKIEDKSICAKCGGACCKGGGCAYLSSDFDCIRSEIIEQALATERISIAATLSFEFTKNGVPIANPTLFLRARNKERDAIDLVSIPYVCASLEETGCYFDLEHRPSGGATMVPDEHQHCKAGISREELINSWLPYQNILRRIVKRHTGMSVEQKIKADVEHFVYRMLKTDCINENKTYKLTMLGDLSSFELAFPEEFQRAVEKVKKEELLIRYRKLK